MKTLMHCVLMVSTVWASCSYLAASLIHMKEGTFTVTPIMAAGFFIGNYIGILGIVPVVLLVNLDFRSSAIYAQFRRVVHSRLTLDIVLFALPAITLLSLVSLRGSEDARHIARMSMFLPVAWLTLKHGWRAAVVGGALAIASTCLLTQSRPDPEILQTQAFIALAITCLLGTGARISAQLLQEEKTRRNEISSQRMARRNFHVNELRRRQTSAALENLGSNLHVTNSRLIEQVRRILPHVDNQGYLKQARATQNQVYALAESMHPQAWRDRGLPAALNETIGRALDEAGMAYECVIGGRGLSRMSAPVLAAAYRSVCEAVVFVSSQPTCVSVRVRLRGGETQGKQWLTLRVEGLHAPHGEAAAARHATERQRLATKLGASALDGDQMRDLVNIFNGELHLRSSDQHERVTVLLHDAPYGAEGTDNGPEPMRLWVN